VHAVTFHLSISEYEPTDKGTSKPSTSKPSTSKSGDVSSDIPTTKRPRPISYAEMADVPDVSDLDLSDEADKSSVFEMTIQTLIANGVKPRGIMKVLNSVICDLKLDKDFLSVNKVKKRIDELYATKIDAHEETATNLKYLGEMITLHNNQTWAL